MSSKGRRKPVAASGAVKKRLAALGKSEIYRIRADERFGRLPVMALPSQSTPNASFPCRASG